MATPVRRLPARRRRRRVDDCRRHASSGAVRRCARAADPVSGPGAARGRPACRVRTFTPDCNIDAASMPLVWLRDVTPDDSIAWLAPLVSSAPDIGEEKDRVRRRRSPQSRCTARRPRSRPRGLRRPGAPDGFAATRRSGSDRARRSGRPTSVAAARPGPERQGPRESDLRPSVSKVPAALTTLIATARDDAARRCAARRCSGWRRAPARKPSATITAAIDDDPDTEVKKKAVFALSQLPKDEGVPLLIEVARTTRTPRCASRRCSGSARSKDPRALEFFEDILLPGSDRTSFSHGSARPAAGRSPMSLLLSRSVIQWRTAYRGGQESPSCASRTDCPLRTSSVKN